jgi:hemerythrin-like metal-binding protein
MSQLTWEERFQTGIEEIDIQHKALFDLVVSLGEALRGKPGEIRLEDLIPKLESYAKDHLSYEEALFTKYDYPGAKEHVKAHDKLRGDIVHFMDMLKNDRLTALVLFNYMELWLYNHVMKMDMDYKAYLIRLGIISDGFHA